MDIKILIPYLILCGNIPWSACNPHPTSFNGIVGDAMDETSEDMKDIHGGNIYHRSLKDMGPNLWRRSGNPGMTLAKKILINIWS